MRNQSRPARLLAACAVLLAATALLADEEAAWPPQDWLTGPKRPNSRRPAATTKPSSSCTVWPAGCPR